MEKSGPSRINKFFLLLLPLFIVLFPWDLLLASYEECYSLGTNGENKEKVSLCLGPYLAGDPDLSCLSDFPDFPQEARDICLGMRLVHDDLADCQSLSGENQTVKAYCEGAALALKFRSERETLLDILEKASPQALKAALVQVHAFLAGGKKKNDYPSLEEVLKDSGLFPPKVLDKIKSKIDISHFDPGLSQAFSLGIKLAEKDRFKEKKRKRIKNPTECSSFRETHLEILELHSFAEINMGLSHPSSAEDLEGTSYSKIAEESGIVNFVHHTPLLHLVKILTNGAIQSGKKSGSSFYNREDTYTYLEPKNKNEIQRLSQNFSLSANGNPLPHLLFSPKVLDKRDDFHVNREWDYGKFQVTSALSPDFGGQEHLPLRAGRLLRLKKVFMMVAERDESETVFHHDIPLDTLEAILVSPQDKEILIRELDSIGKTHPEALRFKKLIR